MRLLLQYGQTGVYGRSLGPSVGLQKQNVQEDEARELQWIFHAKLALLVVEQPLWWEAWYQPGQMLPGQMA